MAHGINDHVPVGAAVAVPAEFLNKVLDLLHPIHANAVVALEDRALPPEPAQDAALAAPAGFSADQFSELVRLLTPVHALAIKVLEQMTEVAELAPPEGKPAPEDTESRSDSERGSG